MTSVTPHGRETLGPAPVACVTEGGCSYLRALSTIERLAGFDQTASSYASAASRCQRLGCWAAEGAHDSHRHQESPSCAPVAFDSHRPSPRRSAIPAHTAVVAPIPFVRSAMVDAISDRDGNYVERRTARFDTLFERGDPLTYLYEYWRGLRAETECRFSNIDTVHLMRAGIIGSMHVVDVRSADPQDFRFELTGYAVPLGPFEKPRALPYPIYADITMRDYNTARLMGTARLHRVRAHLGGTAHHYTRLILPFFDTKGSVARLLVAIRQEPGNGVKLQAGE
jgi:hypothetical protein